MAESLRNQTLDQQFESWWHGVQREIERVDRDDQRQAPRFNVFQVLGIQRKEVVTHSRFLASLLDPRGTHGQGDLFLRTFLAHQALAEFCRGADPESWTVAVEESHEGYGRFDLVLRCSDPRLVIVIENKVDAAEREKQCSDYADWIDEVANPRRWKGLLVYLTPDGRASESMVGRENEYIRLGYDAVARILDSALGAETPRRLQTVVHQYTQIVRELADGTDGRFLGMKDKELATFLRRGENVDTAFRVAKAMDHMRKGLLSQFFGAVLAQLGKYCPGFENTWKEVQREVAPSDSMLCLYQRKDTDQLGLAAQLWRDHLFVGLCWRSPRPPSDYKPAAADPALRAAFSVLRDVEEPDDYWLAHIVEDVTAEDACRSAATEDGRPEALGQTLASLLRATENAVRKANDALEAG